jgi:hypothetical protein
MDRNGQLLSGSEGPYVLLQGSTVSAPDWSNGTVTPAGKIITSGLDINYDGINGETFIDQPDWYSLNLQQVSARPNANGLSLNVGISDIGISDIGISDIGISDIGTSQLGQDALGDQDYASYVLSGGLNPPSGLTAAVSPTNSATGGTGNLLNWIGNTGVATQYNIYRCNATGTCVFALLASVTATSGTPPAVITTFTDSVNNFVQAGSTCPANNTCYNYCVTEVNAIAGLSSETSQSNIVSSDVTHLTVIANSQTLTYGATNPTPTFTVYSNVVAATSLAGVTCAYSPSPSTNANGYNYRVTFVNSAATSVITPPPLSASIIGNPSRPYNGNSTATLASTNFSLTVLQGSDNFTVTQTVGTYNSPNVATATTVTATLAAGNFTPLGGTLATNYTLPATASGPGTITPVTLLPSLARRPGRITAAQPPR